MYRLCGAMRRPSWLAQCTSRSHGWDLPSAAVAGDAMMKYQAAVLGADR